MNFDFDVIASNWQYLLIGRTADGEIGGLLLTLLMSLSAGLIALVAGMVTAAVAWYFQGWSRRVLFSVAELIRSIPLILVIFWLYFLLPRWLGRDISGVTTVVLAIAWFSAASVMHATLAGLEALPDGQTEAGIVSGMSRWQVLRHILLPQALPNLLPSYTGLFVALIKDMSLALVVNVPELTTVANQVNSRTQIYPAEIFLFIGAIYFILCTALSELPRLVLKTRPL
ncbi:amino acid ABC transporter permease [Undibacterium rugosum]|uniref:Amino acid ABC transporter permease n=1 Tax=Undibacterium rugosum TaxID=2762291 RepID=A0A923KYM4_9BURK|nr:amino acid ABC transporter permease [Undibacterium rugosum]MBC3934533.1 amino acid ABC transporter permease [Undibacterium rugosum]MBR7777148.1 amino acid ABC transporter permease [Undibacterium rugosum]